MRVLKNRAKIIWHALQELGANTGGIENLKIIDELEFHLSLIRNEALEAAAAEVQDTGAALNCNSLAIGAIYENILARKHYGTQRTIKND